MTMDLKCECGGVLQHARLSEFDFSAFVGFKTVVRSVDGLRCSKCSGETLDGKTINIVLRSLTLCLLKLPYLLPGEYARFLRKRMRLTQEALAARMGTLSRVTIAKWETGELPISSANDFMLRGLVVAQLERAPGNKDLAEALGRARIEPPAQLPSPLVVDEFLKRSRPPESRRHKS